MAKTADQMTVEELEQALQACTAERQANQAKARALNKWLAQRLEEQRVSNLLGRPVQIIEAGGIESAEAVGDVQQ